jgi:hypothetical protein
MFVVHDDDDYDYDNNNGDTGIVSKSLQKCLETIPGQHSIDSLQKLPY